jgi:hypothetical protein
VRIAAPCHRDAEAAGRLAVGEAAELRSDRLRGITKALEDGVAVGRRTLERTDSTGSYTERIDARFRTYAEIRAHLGNRTPRWAFLAEAPGTFAGDGRVATET